VISLQAAASERVRTASARMARTAWRMVPLGASVDPWERHGEEDSAEASARQVSLEKVHLW
jgi:hypothetical protein